MNQEETLRATVWWIASELHGLSDLQEYASSIEASYPVDMKQAAEILAEAQLKLRKMRASRNG